MKKLAAKILIFDRFSDPTAILILCIITLLLMIFSSAWDYPYGQDAISNIKQMMAQDVLARSVHGVMHLLGVPIYMAISFLGGNVYFAFNLMNIICSLIFVTGIYLIFVMSTQSKGISFLAALSLFSMPNIWWMTTQHAYYSTEFLFLVLSTYFFLRKTNKSYIFSGACLGLSLMSNPAIGLITPLYLSFYEDSLKKKLKSVAKVTGISLGLLAIWIAITYKQYLFGSWGVFPVFSGTRSNTLNPVRIIAEPFFVFLLNYHLLLPAFLIGILLVCRRKISLCAIGTLALLLNYYFLSANYGRYLMPFIIFITIVFLLHFAKFYPLKMIQIKILLLLYILGNMAIGIWGYAIPERDIGKDYRDLIIYLGENNRARNIGIISGGTADNLVSFYYPDLCQIDSDPYYNGDIINELDVGREYFYIPQADPPIKKFLRRSIPQRILLKAGTLTKDPLRIFQSGLLAKSIIIDKRRYKKIDYYRIMKVARGAE